MTGNLESRKKNFKVIVEPAGGLGLLSDEVNLCVSKNGSDFVSISLLPDELDAVVEELKAGKWRREQAGKERYDYHSQR
jgi:hypothetical protein